MEDADGHLEAWPVVSRLVPIAFRIVELYEDLPPGEPLDELARDLDPALAPYAWAHAPEWAVAAQVLDQVAEVLENLTIHQWTLPPGPCEGRKRRASPRGR